METEIHTPAIIIAVVVLLFVIMVCVFIWIAKGGNYYRKYPVAAEIDELAKKGKLEGADLEAAIRSIDPSAPSHEQKSAFVDAIKNQK